MRVALVNPDWSFEGSIYFGCRAPHLPLELGYSRALLEAAGHEAMLVDAHAGKLPLDHVGEEIAAFAPDLVVVTTAPSYLFWRCPPPELRVPMALVRALRGIAPIVAIGPHGSATPHAALEKLGVDAVVLGEAEEIVVRLAETPRDRWATLPALCLPTTEGIRATGAPHASDMTRMPALQWSPEELAGHAHHHHRFDAPQAGLGAELEASRGCPYRCTFCNKEKFRDAYRRRPLPVVLQELDRLVAVGVGYVYFIDEIFLPDRRLLEALVERSVQFGVQTRIDLWKPEMLALLGRAGCVSIEAGVESLTEAGRDRLDKDCRISTEALTLRLIEAKRHVAFVQGNLIAAAEDEAAAVEAWRQRLQSAGVWANTPVPLFPYPGSPEYRLRWGEPDERAWERAHAAYLEEFDRFSDIQEARPLPIAELERAAS